jgi:hypothetical protein
MGQFNYDEPIGSVIFWHAQWKRFFQHVVVAGLESLYNITAFVGRADKGLSSPMENMNTVMQHYFNLKQKQMEMDGDVDSVESVKGVLYIHDDALVNSTELRPWLGSSTTIIASADTSNPRVGWNNNTKSMREVAKHSYSILFGFLARYRSFMQLFRSCNVKLVPLLRCSAVRIDLYCSGAFSNTTAIKSSGQT